MKTKTSEIVGCLHARRGGAGGIYCGVFDGLVEGWRCNEHCTEYRTNPAENEEDD